MLTSGLRSSAGVSTVIDAGRNAKQASSWGVPAPSLGESRRGGAQTPKQQSFSRRDWAFTR